MKRDFLQITDFSRDELFALFALCAELKAKTKARQQHHLLKGQTLAMLFQKPSTRTRVSFEVGMYQLGGHALYLSPAEIGLGSRESVADVARVLSRFNDGIMARVFGHAIVEELAETASVPVINGLSDLTHPCQVLGDLFTACEHKGRYENFKVAYIGDGNNVTNSWMNLAALLHLDLRIACPPGYEPNMNLLEKAKAAKKSDISIYHDPFAAIRDADIVYTDVWASMGQEDEAAARKKIFAPYQVNKKLLTAAANDCIVEHCLPAHRGDEITDEVIDGAHSVVFDQAENRLHIQKAILVTLMR
ncbi:ornithine carbamoyltransferase [candidate division KSB1 bacterium]|nr:ornithine carbamoyltransferase [candidate division KSB1 bacterium]RQV99812.1 MAG: ornithine carbamoyltransferase [candidate division KSB1 bacterium]